MTSSQGPMPAFENLRIDRHGAAALVTITRPKVLNALDTRTLAELREAVQRCAADPDIRGIILTGEGRAFVAGADIEHLSTLGPREARTFSQYGELTMKAIESAAVPVIAAVNGFALGGGCELALSCDIIIASSKASFGQPEVNLGLIPGFGGTQRLSRLIGKNLARHMIFTGVIFDSEWALKHQLVSEVVEPDALLSRCFAIVEIIATRGPVAVATAKRVIQRGHDLDIDTALEIESLSFGELFASHDAKEGMQAFLAKRHPAFQGR